MDFMYEPILYYCYDLQKFFLGAINTFAETFFEEEEHSTFVQDDGKIIIHNNIIRSRFLDQYLVIITMAYIVMMVIKFAIYVIMACRNSYKSSVISGIDKVSRRVIKVLCNREGNLKEKLETQQLKMGIIEEKVNAGFANMNELIRKVLSDIQANKPNPEAQHGTAPNDTAPNDTAPNDTAPNDTAPNDTAPNDTALNNTNSNDNASTITSIKHKQSNSTTRLLSTEEILQTCQVYNISRNLAANIYDVPGDGHCGFRSIAAALGRTGRNDWIDIVTQMENYLDSNPDLFKCGVFRPQEMKHILTNKDPKPCGYEFYFMEPEHCQLAAETFKRIVVSYSRLQTDLFIPYNIESVEELASCLPIGIIQTGNHYLNLELKEIFDVDLLPRINFDHYVVIRKGFSAGIFPQLFPSSFTTTTVF